MTVALSPDIYSQSNDKAKITIMATVFTGGNIFSARVMPMEIEIPREELADYRIVDGIAHLTPEAKERKLRGGE